MATYNAQIAVVASGGTVNYINPKTTAANVSCTSVGGKTNVDAALTYLNSNMNILRLPDYSKKVSNPLVSLAPSTYYTASSCGLLIFTVVFSSTNGGAGNCDVYTYVNDVYVGRFRDTVSIASANAQTGYAILSANDKFSFKGGQTGTMATSVFLPFKL